MNNKKKTVVAEEERWYKNVETTVTRKVLPKETKYGAKEYGISVQELERKNRE
jgi:hypothetical protein